MKLEVTSHDESTVSNQSNEYDGDGTTLHLPTSVQPDESWYHGAMVSTESSGVNNHVVYPDLHCFTPDHEVVTKEGVVNITDLDVGDMVYSINPNTKNVSLKPVTETHSYPNYSGKLVDIDMQSSQFSVTPNHKMLLSERDSDTHEFIRADNIEEDKRYTYINEWNGVDGNGIENVDVTDYLQPEKFDICGMYNCHGHAYRSSLPDGCEKKRRNSHQGFFFDGKTFKEYQDSIEDVSTETYIAHPDGGGSKFRPYKFFGDDFIEFIGWFVTEGSVSRSNDDSNTCSVSIAQKDERHRDRIEYLLKHMGLSPSKSNNGFEFGSAVYGDLLDMICGNGSYNKSIPEFVFQEASLKQKKLLYDTMMKGDGYNSIYYTNSNNLKDGFVRLCVEIGMKPYCNKRHGTWEITAREINDGVTGGIYTNKTTADSGVYCVSVADNHTLLAGQDGRFQWIGQSMYPSIMLTLNIGPDTIVGTSEDLRESEYDESNCVNGFIDTRPVKRCDDGEDYNQYTGGKYKAVLKNGSKKWSDEPEYTKCYYLRPDVKEGFVTQLIDDFMVRKKESKGTDLYAATKAVLNSIYGVFGWATDTNSFRLFDHRVAETVTLTGRKVLQHMMDTVVEYSQQEYDTGSYITHYDTDGVGVSLDVSGQDEALTVAENAVDYLESTGYPRFLKDDCGYTDDIVDGHHLSADIEYYSPSIYNHEAKKRYSKYVTWDEGEDVDDIEITGFDAIRSDVANITVDVQTEVFDLILRNDLDTVKQDVLSESQQREDSESPEGLRNTKSQVYEYISDTITEVKNGDVPIEDLGVRGGIGQSLDEYGTENRTPQPIYRAARWSNQNVSGENIGQASKPYYWPIKEVTAKDLPKQYDSHTAEDGDVVDYVAAEDPSNVEDLVRFDYSKMATKQVSDRVRPIIENIDSYSWIEMQEGHVSSSLDQFM